MAEKQETGIKKNARDAVNALFAQGKAAGPSEAAQLACRMIGQAARSQKDPRRSVADVCLGVMEGLFLHNQDLPETALKIMESLPNMSLIMRVGPQDLMTWVMEGIAEATPMTGARVRSDIQRKLDERYTGVGLVFSSLCDQVGQKGK